MQTVNELANRVRPSGHRIPSWQSGTGWISKVEPRHVVSVSSSSDILEDSCSTPASAQHTLPLRVRGSGTQRQFQPSTLLLQAASSLRSSYMISSSMIHTVLSAACKHQLPSWGCYESCSRTPPISQWHQHQCDTQFAKSAFHPAHEVHGIFLQSEALAESVAGTTSPRPANGVRETRLQFSLRSRRVESSPHRRARQAAYQSFPSISKICHV